LPHAKFSKKADVFAAGIIFLELISLCPPNTLYQDLWPRIIEVVPLPSVLIEILSKSLAESPKTRTGSFEELLLLLRISEEKAVVELINDADFSIDVSPGGKYVSNKTSAWLDLPFSSAPVEQSVTPKLFSRGREGNA
jgi:serine/threonine protein kinase